MKDEAFSVAPVETYYGEFDVFRLGDAKQFSFSIGILCRHNSISNRQPNITLDYFTEFVDGNVHFTCQKNSLDLLYNRIKFYFLFGCCR